MHIWSSSCDQVATPSSLHTERISAQVSLPGRHLVDLEAFQMHSRSQAYLPKALEKVVLTRLGPISSSFNRSVLLKGAIRMHTCPHLIDLISNGVLHVLPSRSTRYGPRYVLVAYLYDGRRQIHDLCRIFEFSNSVDHISRNVMWDKSTQHATICQILNDSSTTTWHVSYIQFQ